MGSIEIRNVGSIKSISFILNKINIFIGPQICGKSTIAKIISFCLWMEKDVLTHQGTSYINSAFFEKNLLQFHQLQNYFRAESFIKYESDILKFEYTSTTFSVQEGENLSHGKVGKNAYIPAERNIINLPGIITLPLGETNIKSFLSDWVNIRNKYTNEYALPILGLNAKYYFNKDTQQDTLILDEGNEIKMNEASSGLQSIVPLYIYIDYLTRWIYEHVNDTSVSQKQDLEFTIFKAFFETLKKNSPSFNEEDVDVDEIYTNANLKNIFQNNINHLVRLKSDLKGAVSTPYDAVVELFENISKPHYSNIIIEEPEQNLFPQTQVDLITNIFEKINKQRDHLIITTHSPYVLYAINNCMLGYLVKNNIEKCGANTQFHHKTAWVNPQNVSIWALKDGGFYTFEGSKNKTIQDEEGLIRNNYFDQIMQNVMGQFNNLLNFYEPHE